VRWQMVAVKHWHCVYEQLSEEGGLSQKDI
jgi:hypothetical protein